MDIERSEEARFGRELVALSRQAVECHHLMSGNPTPPDEKFIRDWIALKLYTSQRRQAMMEVKPGEFWNWVAKAPRQTVGGFGRVDLIIFGKDEDNAEMASAIIELKRDANPRNLANIKKDITRTARLLSHCKHSIAGYQLVCIVVGNEAIRKRLTEGLRGVVHRFGVTCGQTESEEFEMQDGKSKAWCCIHAIPVRAAALNQVTGT